MVFSPRATCDIGWPNTDATGAQTSSVHDAKPDLPFNVARFLSHADDGRGPSGKVGAINRKGLSVVKTMLADTLHRGRRVMATTHENILY